MYTSIPFHLLDLSSDKPEFDVEAGSDLVLVHNAARQAVTTTLRLESDAPCRLQAGASRRVDCAAGAVIVCIVVDAEESLVVTAGSEDVSVEVHSIVTVPG